MNRKILFFTFLLLLIQYSLSVQAQDAQVLFKRHEKENRIDVMVQGKLFTSYMWPVNVYKPILYPVFTSSGTEITRGFPLNPREGERNDHIHQVGIWLNYGKVNGLDFWGNGHRGYKEPEGGEIKHLSVEKTIPGTNEGILVAQAEWLGPRGKKLLDETTEYHFIARGSLRMIDRLTTLKAGDTVVVFSDTKEGMFGIRVARQLELPATGTVTLLDASGKPSDRKVSAAEGVTGNYRSSRGATGEAVWGTRAEWMNLYGTLNGEKVSVTVCDHHDNPGYPTYWHARGYGLFAANPLGWTDFTKGKESFNFTLQPGQSTTFRYRVIISNGLFPDDNEINDLAKEFNNRY
ncbi:MAG TPA: PmoA family protein [Bacteroidales bacterium]|nr:PmoA family protein [Bacteroidales bacterium]HPF02008.1 PmoA family protein [Bacteroidales bacterium]HPJ60392.1 PmoA family protein [Bacteroidales bacterium]HPR12576.1 PmoA family protein [Bacteroidales bacterium]HRW86527.1 PmoA family protein [Bacteroidales bacterium]